MKIAKLLIVAVLLGGATPKIKAAQQSLTVMQQLAASNIADVSAPVAAVMGLGGVCLSAGLVELGFYLQGVRNPTPRTVWIKLAAASSVGMVVLCRVIAPQVNSALGWR